MRRGAEGKECQYGVALFHLIDLEFDLDLNRKDKTKPVIYLGEQSRVESSDALSKKRLVHSDDLRDIDCGRFRKPGSLDRQANISRRVGQAQVRCDDRRDNRADAAVIETIRRNDK